jgi:hypothetical protein
MIINGYYTLVSARIHGYASSCVPFRQAEELRANAEKFAQATRESAKTLAKIPVMSKGVGRSEGQFKKWALPGGSISLAMVAMVVLWRRRR